MTAFTDWYLDQLGTPVADDAVTARALGDLDANGHVDFVVTNSDPMWCGSGGCAETVYAHFPDIDPAYEEVFSVLGGEVVGTRAEPGYGFLSLEVAQDHVVREAQLTDEAQLVTEDPVVGTPVLTVYRLQNFEYVPSSYEIECAALGIECDDPLLSIPSVHAATDVVDELAPAGRFPVEEDAEVLVAPREEAAPLTDLAGLFDEASMPVVGVVPGEEWILVDTWKGNLGFVRLQE